MTTRRTALAWAVIALVLGSTASAIAQSKKKPSSYPGKADFRCNGLSRDAVCSDQDRIKGDFSSYVGFGIPEAGEGAHFRSNSGNTHHEMWIGIRNSLRVYLDFSVQVEPGSCAPNCLFGTAFPTAEVTFGATVGEIQSQVVNPLDTSDPTPTLLDMPDDATWPTRLYVAFADASGRGWSYSFSDIRSSGAPSPAWNASVTRLDSCTWEFSGSRGELSTVVRVSGKQFRLFEGVYDTPFLIRFEAPGCPGTFPQ
jgi:hypothetical protein